MIWQLKTRADAIPAGPVEARCLTTELQSCQSTDQALNIQVWVGSASVSLGELVLINQINDDQNDLIELTGDFSRWNGIGSGLKSGRIEIRGDVGSRTGAEISGGVIEIVGNTGSWTGVNAKSGRIAIQGNTGNWLGANWPGEVKGMSGGEIIVTGDAGEHAGVRMRRGTIAIAGSAGAGLGRAMIAGSIVVGSTVFGPVGSGMKRGTIIMSNQKSLSDCLLPGFHDAGTFRPLTLNMQLQYLSQIGWQKATELLESRNCNRYTGDHLTTGLGEVLILSGAPGSKES